MRASTIPERLNKLRYERNALQRYVSRRIFPLSQRLGFHIVGDHFYEPLPNTKLVNAIYRDEPQLQLAIDYRYEKAERLLVSAVGRWGHDFYPDATRLGFQERNHFFRGLDSISLYSVIRELRPARIIEIGQGASTLVALAALERVSRESGRRPVLTSIDLYPRMGRPNVQVAGVDIELVRAPVQHLAPAIFQQLGKNDMLFVDSSHVYKFGSDVAFEFEHVYPTLARGVVVHAHDVFSPYPYPLDWYVKSRRFWNEQHVLEQMLSGGGLFEVLIPVNYLARTSSALRTVCEAVCKYPDYKHQGSSFYMEALGRARKPKHSEVVQKGWPGQAK